MEQILTAAMKGSKKVRFTFRPEGIDEIPYLLGMASNGIIQLKPGDALTLECVQASGEWERPANRTLEIQLTETFDRGWFEGRMTRACQSITAA
jgi:hypothetical protein